MNFTKEYLLDTLPLWLQQQVTIPDQVSFTYARYLDGLAKSGERLVLRALKASAYSESYRPFPVGCAVLAVFSHSNSVNDFTGHNMKVGEKERVICSEVIAIGAARQKGCTHIPLMAVVGNPQPDQGSGLCTPTLHPCFRCRAELSELSVVTPDTIIITATHDAAVQLRADTDRLFESVTEFDPVEEYPIGKPFEALRLVDNVREEVSLDALVEKNIAEVMTFEALLQTHNYCV